MNELTYELLVTGELESEERRRGVLTGVEEARFESWYESFMDDLATIEFEQYLDWKRDTDG